MWRLVLAILIVVGAVSPALADQAPAPETFADGFVQAINSKDPDRIKALIHTKSLACLTGENAALLANDIENKFKRTIPASYKVTTVTEIKPTEPLVAESFFPNKFTYPVRPTYRLQIDYVISPNHGGALMPEIVLEGKTWKEVFPCPKEGTQAWLKAAEEEKKKKEAEQARVVEALLGSMQKPYLDEITTMGKNGHWIDAVHKIVADKHVDLAEAYSAMKIIVPPDSVSPNSAAK